MGRHGPDVLLHHLARPVDAELREQERDLASLAREDLVLGRQVPELALERADGLLPRRVDELLVGLAVLALVGGIPVAPGLDLAMERLGKGGVLAGALEPGRQVLAVPGRPGSDGTARREGRGAALDGAASRSRDGPPKPSSRST
jgi:hypothetical protein